MALMSFKANLTFAESSHSNAGHGTQDPNSGQWPVGSNETQDIHIQA